MQRREADIFIDSAYTSLAKQRVPALSIHDCIGPDGKDDRGQFELDTSHSPPTGDIVFRLQSGE
jgi:hypothetical protein